MPEFGNYGHKEIDHSVFKRHSTESYRWLEDAFVAYFKTAPFSTNDSLEERYFQFLFSIQFHSGLATMKNVNELLRLETSALRDILGRWLYLPRFNGEVPLKLNHWTALLGQLLLLRLGRGKGRGRNRFGMIEDARLAALVFGPNVSDKEIRTAYYRWLRKLGKKANLSANLSYSAFVKIVQHHFSVLLPEMSLLELYWGLWPYNPAPISQYQDFKELAKELDFSRIKSLLRSTDFRKFVELPKPLRVYLGLEGDFSLRDEKPVPYDPLPLLRKHVSEYLAFEEKPEPKARAKFRRWFKKTAKYAEAQLGIDIGTWGQGVNALSAKGLSQHQIEWIATSAVGRWLAHSLRGKGVYPSTLANKFYRIVLLLKDFEGRLPINLIDEDMTALRTYRGYAVSSFNSLVIDLHLFRLFVKRELGGRISKGFNAARLYDRSIYVKTVPLLTKNGIERILGALLLFGKPGYLSYHILLLQISYGFRGSATCNVVIDGVNDLLGYPTVLGPPTKGRLGFDSQIPQEHHDQGILKALRAFLKLRIKEEQGDLSQPLFALDGVKFTYQQYSYYLNKAMHIAEVEIMVGEKRSLSHLFRHYFANRFLSIGLNIDLIKEYMGHRHSSSTGGNYLHGVSFILAEKLFMDQPMPDLRVSRLAAARLLGIGERQLRNQVNQILEDIDKYKPLNFCQLQTLAIDAMKKGAVFKKQIKKEKENGTRQI